MARWRMPGLLTELALICSGVGCTPKGQWLPYEATSDGRLPHSTASDVAPACPPPVVDTTGWTRFTSRSAGISLLLPPGWSQDRCRPSDVDGQLWCGPLLGDRLFVDRSERAPEPPVAHGYPHPSLHFTACEEVIDGQRVWIAAYIATGYSHVAGAYAAWKLPDGSHAYITAMGEKREAHERMLAVLRHVKVLPARARGQLTPLGADGRVNEAGERRRSIVP